MEVLNEFTALEVNMLYYVYRKMRSGEEEKIDRFLQKTINERYNPNYLYHVVTTTNPEKVRNRLIVGVVGKQVVITQVAVANKWKNRNVLEFMLANVRDEGHAYNSVSIITKNWRVIRALITSGWWWYKVQKNGMKFLSKRNHFAYDPVISILHNHSFIFDRKEIWRKIKLKLFPVKPVPRYILGEKVVSIFQYLKHDKRYRKFSGWKPTITVFSDDIRDILPTTRQTIKLPDEKYVSTYNISMLYRMLDMEDEFSPLLTNELYDEKGTSIVKRMVQFAKSKGKKVDSKTIHAMGEYLRESGIMGLRIQYELVTRIDWEVPNNQWMEKAHPSVIEDLFNTGHGYAIKLMLNNNKFVGRIFMSAENDALLLWQPKILLQVCEIAKFVPQVEREIANSLNLKKLTTLIKFAGKDSTPKFAVAGHVMYRARKGDLTVHTLNWLREENTNDT